MISTAAVAVPDAMVRLFELSGSYDAQLSITPAFSLTSPKLSEASRTRQGAPIVHSLSVDVVRIGQVSTSPGGGKGVTVSCTPDALRRASHNSRFAENAGRLSRLSDQRRIDIRPGDPATAHRCATSEYQHVRVRSCANGFRPIWVV